MADLTPLQTASIIVGVIGGALGVINTVQGWRKNRPIVSVNAGASPVDGDIDVYISNPAMRPITIRCARCYGGAHGFKPIDYMLYIAGATMKDINIEIAAGGSVGFKLTGNNRFAVLVYWHSNSAFIFSFLPLIIVRTQRQVDRLRLTRRIE